MSKMAEKISKRAGLAPGTLVHTGAIKGEKVEITVVDYSEDAHSNKMNAVMKVLTIIATIFIPLSFLAGIYGMNFENMPELKYSWSYPVFWIVIISLVIGMFAYFRKKKWL